MGMKPVNTMKTQDADALFNSLLPDTKLERIVIVGGGVAGVELAGRLDTKRYQVVLIDRNEHCVYQPLCYKEHPESNHSGSMRFPYNDLFSASKRIQFIQTDAIGFSSNENTLITRSGKLTYNRLVIASGYRADYFNNNQKKSSYYSNENGGCIDPARIMQYIVICLQTERNNFMARFKYRNIAIIGGGRAGVELAAQLAEFKKRMTAGDPVVDAELCTIQIYLIEPGEKLLNGMSSSASAKAKNYLESLDVKVCLNAGVIHHNNDKVVFDDMKNMDCHICIWANKQEGQLIQGFGQSVITKDKRLRTDLCNRVAGYENVYAIGYIAFVTDRDVIVPSHPTLYNSIVQAKTLASNLNSGATATWKKLPRNKNAFITSVGWGRAVGDLGSVSFHGNVTKWIWLLFYLRIIPGMKNKIAFLKKRIAARMHYSRTFSFLVNRPAIYRQIALPVRILAFPFTFLRSLVKK